MKRIEDPMMVFRENKAICQIKDFGRIVRIYNKLASVLITFETLWFNHYSSMVDSAFSGLNRRLLAIDRDTKEIVVYADVQ